jgi:hypothetical protein
MIEVLSGGVVALLTLSGTWLTARAKRKSDRDTTSLGWVDRMNSRLAAQDEKIAKQDEKLSAMAREMEELRLSNFDLRALVQEFVHHVRQWRHRTPPSEWPEPSREVAERMGDED